MKRSLVLLAAVIGLGGWLYAGQGVIIPEADNIQVAPVDYVGLDYSTSSFSVNFTTPINPLTGTNLIGSIAVRGVTFSTGNTVDFVQIYDATSTVNAVATGEVCRIYNLNNSTTSAGAIQGGLGGGFSKVGDTPIKLNKGLIWRVSSAAYNSVIVHFYKNK